MAQEQAQQLLQQGIAAARDNRPGDARRILQQAVRLDPQNDKIWLWLSSVAVDDNERVFCLKQLLTLDPHNDFALKGLRALGVEPGAEEQQATGSTVPLVDDEKFARVSQAVDDFLRRYNPYPADHLGIQWTHKQRRRYGEKGAVRLRQMAIGGVVL
ncbi:MAG: hypothetical protein GYB65_00695, partial [Chloroflexi bacterium]|nr:hypothetical protein [Chloroflexota bacterium]